MKQISNNMTEKLFRQWIMYYSYIISEQYNNIQDIEERKDNDLELSYEILIDNIVRCADIIDDFANQEEERR